MPAPNPSAAVVVREHDDQPFYEAKFIYRWVEQDPGTGKQVKRHKQVKRRIGPAWLDRNPDTGKWDLRRKGRVPDGHYDQRGATVRAAAIVADYVADAGNLERADRERRSRGVTFREVATGYLRWLADVAGAKPATLRDHGYVLGEPGVPYKRGTGVTAGHVMAALGDRPASKITTREIDQLLTTISATGASARTVNKYRCVIARSSTTGASFYVRAAGEPRRGCRQAPRAPPRGASLLLARGGRGARSRAGDGRHRGPSRPSRQRCRSCDARHARISRTPSWSGSLPTPDYASVSCWHCAGETWTSPARLTVARAMSAGVESSTKSGRVRACRCPISCRRTG